MGIVYPIIQQMMNMGIRIWFDDAIAPGSQWPDYIAQHIDECDAFIAFVSKNYLASDNCKDELEYSRDLNKDRLLIYLEEVKLPSGMAMRMNRLQAINWYTYVSQKDFNSILMECPFIGRNMTGGASADTSAPKDEAPGEDSCKDPEKVHREEQTETKKENGEKPSLWKKFFGR